MPMLDRLIGRAGTVMVTVMVVIAVSVVIMAVTMIVAVVVPVRTDHPIMRHRRLRRPTAIAYDS
jgi:hypothetical protein